MGGVISFFIYNYTTQFTFTKSYFCALILITCGNFFYSIAYNFNSIAILVLGRLMIGLGGGRVLARKYIANFIPDT